MPSALITVTVESTIVIFMSPLMKLSSMPFAAMVLTERSRFESSSMYSTSVMLMHFHPLLVSISTGKDA